MITNLKISIIVPVYNVEKYIAMCIDSILVQSFANFELLLIDDGSRDNSGNICDRYAEKDNRIISIHQQNEGVSSARNKGIVEARGEYICFIDSDDWVDKSFLKDLLNKLDKGLCDLHILTPIIYQYKDKKIERKPPYTKNIYVGNEIVNLLIENDFFTIGDGGSCSKLFKRSIINQNNQRFYLNNAAYEDTIFSFEYLIKCDNVQINFGAHYHYMHRNENSLSTTIHHFNNYLDSGLNGLKILDIIKDKYSISLQHPFYLKGITKFLNMVNYSVFSLYSGTAITTESERLNLLRILEQLNDGYKQFYFPKNIKQKIVNKVLRNGNQKISDIIFIILFKIASIRRIK